MPTLVAFRRGVPVLRRLRRRGEVNRSRPASTRPTVVGAVAMPTIAAVLLASAACGTVSNPIPDVVRPLPEPTAATESSLPVVRSCASPEASEEEKEKAAAASWEPDSVLPDPEEIPRGSELAQNNVDPGYLTVGVRPDTPPFAFLDPDTNEFKGFSVDIAKLVGRKLFGDDEHVKFRAVTSSQWVSLVVDGKLDMVASTSTPTCERYGMGVDFSAPYYLTSPGLLVQKRDMRVYGSDGLADKDLHGRPVCAATGTTAIERLRTVMSRPVVHEVTNVADCLVALQNGDVVAIADDESALRGLAAQNPETEIVGLEEPSDVGGVATAPGLLVQKRDMRVYGSDGLADKDLHGRPVCAARGTTTIQRVRDAMSPKVHEVTNVAECLVALQNGEVDAIANDESALLGLKAQDPQTEIVGLEEAFETGIAAIIDKDRRDLTRFVNGVLTTAMQDGTWTEFYTSQPLLIENRPPPPPPSPTYRTEQGAL